MLPGESNGTPLVYVLDSFALMAYLQGEPGMSRIVGLLDEASKDNVHLHMSIINVGEVAYNTERSFGFTRAQELWELVTDLPVQIWPADRPLTLSAAHLKAIYPIAYADCFAAALASSLDATLLTGDPEFRKLEHAIRIEWLRAEPA